MVVLPHTHLVMTIEQRIQTNANSVPSSGTIFCEPREAIPQGVAWATPLCPLSQRKGPRLFDIGAAAIGVWDAHCGCLKTGFIGGEIIEVTQ